MNMTLRNAIRLALAGGALYASSAMALVPADFSTAERAGNVLRLSGATATDTTILNLAGNRCSATAGQASIYTSRAADGGQVALLCRGNASGGGTLNGIDFAYLKESEAGSANGSVTVSSASVQTLEFLDVFNAGFACRGDDDVAGNGSVGELGNPGTQAIGTGAGAKTINRYSNCTPQALSNAEAGISDVEAGLLGVDGGAATPTSQFQIVFGVPVSLNLYRALQIAQGYASPNAACDTVAEQDTPACVPSLPTASIASIYNGTITSWSQILTSTGAALTTVAPPGGGAPSSNNVYICRRGNTSGTQIGTRAYFLAQGCGGSDTFRLSTNGTCPTGPFANGEANGNAYGSAVNVDCNRDGDTADANEGSFNFSDTVVFAGDGSGDVRNCLDDRDDQDRWAIGVLSLDSNVDGSVALGAGGTTTAGNIGGNGGTARDTLGAASAEAHSREYRFVRVNGYLPDLATLANGGYDFYTENVAYARNGALTGNEANVYNELFGVTAGLSDAANINNAACDNQPWGDGCILGIPLLGDNLPPVSTGGTFLQADLASNPVNTTTRSLSGVANNCSNALSVEGGPGSVLLGPTL